MRLGNASRFSASLAVASLLAVGLTPMVASAESGTDTETSPVASDVITDQDTDQDSTDSVPSDAPVETTRTEVRTEKSAARRGTPALRGTKNPYDPAGKYTFAKDLDPAVGCEGDCLVPPETIQSDGKTYELVWNDEFDGPTLDQTKWVTSRTPENGRFCYYNRQTGDPLNSNLYFKDGALTIQALPRGYDNQYCEVKEKHAISGSIATAGKASWKYGRFEARVRTASGDGMWPALWMMPDQEPYGWPKDGEIDWIENIGVKNNPGVGAMFTTVQLNKPGTNKQAWQAKPPLRKDFDLGEAFHTYAMEWDPGVMKFYFDGKYYGKIENWENSWYQPDGSLRMETPPGPFDKNFFFKANLAVNGGWGPVPEDQIDWDENKFQLDYVRVYQTKEQQQLQSSKYVKFDTVSSVEWPEQMTVEAGTTVPHADLPVITRPGYEFDGWYKKHWWNKTQNTWVYGQPVDGDLVVNDDTQLFAKWVKPAADSVTISFDTAGGPAVGAQRVLIHSDNPLPTPNRDGYIFDGWFESSGSKDPLPAWLHVGTKDVTVHAKWTKITPNMPTVKISYDTQSTLKNPAPRIVRPNQQFWLPELSRPGYTFGGWFTDKQLKNPAKNLFATGSNTTLYAKWTKIEGGATPPDTGSTTRDAGANRFATAVKLSEATFGKGQSPRVVYLANGLDYPDALVAGAAGGKDHAPLLLTEANKLPAETAAELARLKPTYVVAIGGPAVVSQSVLQKASKAAGNAVTSRYAGANRFETAAKTAESFGKSDVVYLAQGMNFPDALTASAAAGAKDAPVLLTMKDQVPSQTVAAIKKLGAKKIVVVGGPGVVSEGAAKQAASKTGAKYVRYGGLNRYETAESVAVNEFEVNPQAAYVATGTDYPDALAASAVAAMRGGPVLLSMANAVPTELNRTLDTLAPRNVVFVGGSAVLSDSVKEQVAQRAQLINK